MLRNRLKLNDSKRETMVFVSPHVKLAVFTSIAVGAKYHQSYWTS